MSVRHRGRHPGFRTSRDAGYSCGPALVSHQLPPFALVEDGTIETYRQFVDS